MAQYDGSIRINTKIDSKQASAQLMTLENRITKTADKIASLRSKMDALKGTKIPTQEYKDISDQIAKVESEFNKLLEKQEQMQREGKDNGTSWDRLNQKMDEAGNTIRYAKGELQDLVDNGKAFALGSDTEEFTKLGQQLKYAENDMDVLVQKHKELTSKQENNSDGYKKLGNSARKSLQSVGSIIKNAKNQAISMGRVLKNIATRIFPFLNRSAQKTDGFFRTMGSRLKGLALSLLIFNQISKVFNSAISGMKEGIGNLAQYSSSVNAALSSMKSALTQLKNSLASAFAPILTVVAPILTSLINMLARAVTYVGMFIAALTGKKTFQKAVAVQEDYAGGLKDTASAAEDTAEAAKEANRQLSSLDKLNNLTSPDSGSGAGGNGNTGGGGGGGGISPGDMFETVEIPGAISDLAAEIREAIKRGDWESVGETIGEALTSALERINWDSIYEKARGFGEGLASFLNGLISPELFSAVAKTIAGSLNTALHFLDSFGTTFDWKNLGNSISEGINSFFRTFDWKLAVKNFNTFSNGLLTTMITAVKGIKWRDISQTIADSIAGLDFYEIGWNLGNLANSLASALYQIVSNKDTWKNLGNQIADGINGFLEGMSAIDPTTGLSGWESLGLSVAHTLNGIKDVLVKAFSENKDDIKDAIGELLGSFFEEIDISTIGVVIGAISIANMGKLSSLFAAVIGTPYIGTISLVVGTIALIAQAIEWATDREAYVEDAKGVSKKIAEALWGEDSEQQKYLDRYIEKFGRGVIGWIQGDFRLDEYWNEFLKPTLEGWFDQAVSLARERLNGFADAFDFSEIFSFDWAFEWFDEAKKAFETAFDGNRDGFFDIGGWILKGILDGFVGALTFIGEPIAKFFTSLFDGICALFGIHSPATEMNPIGENILLGIISGFVGAFSNIVTAIGSFFSNVKNSFLTNMSSFSSYWGGKWNELKNSVINVFSNMWIGIRDYINNILSGIRTAIDGINSLSRAASGVSAVRGSIGSNIGGNVRTLENVPIPKLATGAVLPANREFLAILGDQKHGTNIEAPLSTIEDAMENVLRKSGSAGGVKEVTIHIPFSVDGQIFFELMKKYDLQQFNRTGQPSFQI